MILPAILLKDGYKVSHREQYPVGTTKVYSNFTARISRETGINHVVAFGFQAFMEEYLIDQFNDSFFRRPKDEVIANYRRLMDNYLGPGAISIDHIAGLHDLGFLPLHIKALEEGTIVPLKVPLLTITNTLPEFFWLPNMLETLLSASLWGPITSATIAYEYRKLLMSYAKETSDMPEFVKWQGHDFSMRGHRGVEAAVASAAGHLLSFTGSDTIPAIPWLEAYYGADSDKELIAGSVPATEHSVMCLGGQETEFQTFKRLITEIYPKGIISIVSDTWDYWKVLNETVRKLKPEIMARDGKVVIRPDSGDPALIICGDPQATAFSLARKGTMEILWDIFGGRTNEKGYRQLNDKIGVIYGDSITLDKCQQICRSLKRQGFASTNMVFGIGSYTYQYNTRDTFGFAMKATYGEVNGVGHEIFKDPLTDGGFKKSAKGLLRVNEDLTLSECVTKEEENTGLLKTIFFSGHTARPISLAEIRAKIDKSVLMELACATTSK